MAIINRCDVCGKEMLADDYRVIELRVYVEGDDYYKTAELAGHWKCLENIVATYEIHFKTIKDNPLCDTHRQ